MDKNKRARINVAPLSLEDSTQRIEHQFDMVIARLDIILIHLEKLVKK